jgi:hypothetical protein
MVMAASAISKTSELYLTNMVASEIGKLCRCRPGKQNGRPVAGPPFFRP